MFVRRVTTVVMCAVMAVMFAGCPLAGSMVAGVWKASADGDCDNSSQVSFVLVLATNGTATFITASQDHTGTWSVEDGTLIVVIPVEGTVTFTAPADPSSLNGTYEGGTSTGCWEATKVNA